MPIYGREKVHHMVRSILPSTKRKSAKEGKDRLHRQNRRRSSHNLNQYRGYASDVIEDYLDDSTDLLYWVDPHNNDWDNIVWERRAADKLTHFENWAYEITKHLPVEDRFSKIAGMVPNGVIGNHALSHLDFLKPPRRQRYRFRMYTDEELMMPFRRIRRAYYRQGQQEIRQQRIELWACLYEIHRNDRERNKLNEYMIANCHDEVIRVYNRETYRYDIKLIKRHPPVTMNGYHNFNKFFIAIEKDRYYWDLVIKYFDI